MKGRLVLYCTVGLLFGLSSGRSQSFSIGIGSGILAVQGPEFYTGATSAPGLYRVNGLFSHSNGLDFHTEPQVRALADCYFESMAVGLSLEFTYAFLRGHGNAAFWIGETQVPSVLTTKLDLWSIGIAGRIYLLRSLFSPFVSAAGRVNSFGELRFRYEDKGYWGENNTTETFNRLNVGVGGGCDISIFSKTMVRVECQHSWNNIDHKKEEGEVRSLDVSLSILYEVWQ